MKKSLWDLFLSSSAPVIIDIFLKVCYNERVGFGSLTKEGDFLFIKETQKVWALFLSYKYRGAKQPRKGYEQYGIYDIPEDPDSPRWESDLEHSAGMRYLLQLMHDHFDTLPYWRDVNDAYDVADIHEFGETAEDGVGDIPDNGEKGEEIDMKEREIVKRIVEFGYSRAWAAHLYDKFIEFQERATHFGRTVYCADKTEAILQGLIYEKQGRGGKLNLSVASMLEIDGAKFANTYDLVDIWLYSFILNAKTYEDFECFYEIIVEAARDVRGIDDPFPWAEKLLK